MKIKVVQDYRRLREAEYPSTGSQLDAIFKMAKALSAAGVELPTDTLTWIDTCQAVKDTYPKQV